MRRFLFLALLCASCAGCAGPDHGVIAETRGRMRLREDLEDEGLAAAAQPGVPLFPLLFTESGENRGSVEVLWPLLEWGSGRAGGGSSCFRLRPLLWIDSFRTSSCVVLFPFYWHVREDLEAGDRSIEHLWPFYGVHREWIDLAPAVTHHFVWPLIYFRNGWGRWKAFILPAFAVSSGYLDRGWWLLPVLKAGTNGQSAFFYLLDPLFAYERDSIADGPEDDTPEKRRWCWRILGGLVGWENDRGRSRLLLFWL